MTVLQTESPFGVHRVLEPAGVLPYQAHRLDVAMPLQPLEVRISVEKLNLDSASFFQLKEETHGDLDALKGRVAAIVAERGKMHNPITGSGGVLIGTVSEVGAGRDDLKVGDRVISLISLTTTPLRLDTLGEVVPASHQIVATGEAILFARSPYGKLPSDLDENLVLSVLDVCGAPAQAHRLAKPGMTIAILGAGGRSGLLCAWIAAAQVGETGQIIALEYGEAGLEKLKQVPGPVAIRKVDATNALAVREAVHELTDGKLADLVINCVNVPGTEMGSILAARQRGTVYFFSMATSFQAAALGAESVAQDVDLLMGNGYAEGHAAYALDTVRKYPGLAKLLV